MPTTNRWKAKLTKQREKKTHTTRYKNLVTHVESHASAVSLLESGEKRDIKAINNFSYGWLILHTHTHTHTHTHAHAHTHTPTLMHIHTHYSDYIT